MQIRRTITVNKPIDTVFDYLADFTTTTEWDPGTVATTREHGGGGVGTIYRNTSRFLGRNTELRYEVVALEPQRRICLRGKNATVVADDTMTFAPVPGGTEVTYTAEFSFSGPARYFAALLRPALRQLGNKAEEGMRTALTRLPG